MHNKALNTQMHDNTIETTGYLLIVTVETACKLYVWYKDLKKKDNNRYKSRSMIVTLNPERNHDIAYSF